MRSQAGFTVVEVLIAATILMTGMFATAAMLDQSNATTTSTKTREQAVALQRELVEAARGVPYANVTITSLASLIQQANPALADIGGTSSPGWTIRRRGVTYTVTIGACSVDDPVDGSGPHDPATFCATGSGSATPAMCLSLLGTSGSVQGVGAPGAASGDCGIDSNLDGTVDGLVTGGTCTVGCGTGSDRNPDDYKRIVSLVRWPTGKGARFAIQTATVPNPGTSNAPAIDTLTPPTTAQVTTGTSLTFNAVTSRTPSTVGWSIDGTQKGVATGSGTAWSFSWALGTVSTGTAPNTGEVLDGTYVIGAKAFDVYGASGTTRANTMVINRRAPYPVQGFRGGRNGSVVEFEWSANKEKDIQGYKVFRKEGTGDIEVCALTTKTTCKINSSPAGDQQYYATAYDKDSSGALRAGASSVISTVTVTNRAPYAPGPTLKATIVSGNTVLLWDSSAGDPDAGDKVDYYRIYRDGQTYDDRYDRTTTGTTLTYTDTKTGGTPHDYWIVAVDTQMAESTTLGPVRK